MDHSANRRRQSEEISALLAEVSREDAQRSKRDARRAVLDEAIESLDRATVPHPVSYADRCVNQRLAELRSTLLALRDRFIE